MANLINIEQFKCDYSPNLLPVTAIMSNSTNLNYTGDLVSLSDNFNFEGGDDYDGRFDITVSAKSGSPSLIGVILEISGGTAGTNKVFTGYIQTAPTPPYDQSLLLDFFSLAAFLSNGGRIYAKEDTGSVTITRLKI